MKVLHVSGANSWGGNEQQLVDLIFGLEKLNIENSIFCFENTPIESIAKQKGNTYHSIAKVKAHSLKYAKSLSIYVKAFNPDVIHLHTSNSVTAFVIADLLYKLKTPSVFSKKGISGGVSLLSRFKYNYKKINKIICVSQVVKDVFESVIKPKNHHKLCVVYDGINLERSKNKSSVQLREDFFIDSSKTLIGNVANHTRAKDLVTLVETANELVNTLGVKTVHFVQIGDKGSASDDFLFLIEKYNLGAYFTVTGFLKNALDLFSQLDICIITSEREGGPSSALEAILKKVPIVSTKVGFMPEIIKHNENGMLSEVKDYKSLALNLEKLINNKDLQNVFTEKTYVILLERFTTKQIAENILLIYKDLAR